MDAMFEELDQEDDLEGYEHPFPVFQLRIGV